jgi:hypothetical protein
MRKLALMLSLSLASIAGAATTQSNQLTIAPSKPVIVYGERVVVSGTLRDQPAGSSVLVAIRQHGERSFAPVANEETGAGGTWRFSFEPTIFSELQARSGEIPSRIVTVRVKPRVTLTRRRGALYAQAVAARSFRGRHVWFQLRSKQGRWRSVRKVVLDDPPRRFQVRLPTGISRVRVSLARRQAGPGYEPAVSRVLVLRRRIAS